MADVERKRISRKPYKRLHGDFHFLEPPQTGFGKKLDR
jgi:hypothetical protein